MQAILILITALFLQQPFEYKWPDLKLDSPEFDLKATTVVPTKTVVKPVVDQTKVRRLLYFTATWCGPCRDVQAPVITSLTKSGWLVTDPGKTAHIWKYDFDAHFQTRQRYNVTQAPTFILVDGNGKELNKVVGCQTGQQLADLLAGKTR